MLHAVEIKLSPTKSKLRNRKICHRKGANERSHATSKYIRAGTGWTRRRTRLPTGSVCKGCRGPISTLDDQLTSPTTDHSHDSIFQAKQSLKGKAAQAYLPTKFPCSEAVSGLGKTEQATKQQTPLQPPKP
ncbi:hypothetical protein ACHWQZ_G004074 [Mnemiopsis leidyi]